MRILVTGSAGFIGGALSISLLAKDHKVIGIDNLNDYYDPGFKRARLATFPNTATTPIFMAVSPIVN